MDMYKNDLDYLLILNVLFTIVLYLGVNIIFKKVILSYRYLFNV